MNKTQRVALITAFMLLHVTISCGQDKQHLGSCLKKLAQEASPGKFGIEVIDLQSNRSWRVNAQEEFPMMSDFKVMVAAAVLARVDRGTILLTQKIALDKKDVVPGSAIPSIGDRLQQHEALSVSVRELLAAAVSESDNTAADVLIRLIGGPKTVTSFLYKKGVGGIEISTGERGLADAFDGRTRRLSTPSTAETETQGDAGARIGYENFLQSPPNRTSPHAAAVFMDKLWHGELLSAQSTGLLLKLMYAQTKPHRLRDGLPADARLADKTGTGPTIRGRTAAWNDIGVIVLKDNKAFAVAGYLEDSTASKADRDALFARLARITTHALTPSMSIGPSHSN